MTKPKSSRPCPLADGARSGKCEFCNNTHLVLYDRHDKPIAEWVIGDLEEFIDDLRNPVRPVS
jgi:hypothetical protein